MRDEVGAESDCCVAGLFEEAGTPWHSHAGVTVQLGTSAAFVPSLLAMDSNGLAAAAAL